MSQRQCPECKTGRLTITGMGFYEDTILVECQECDYAAELEPDGLGEGGFEMIEAMQIEYGRDGSDGG